MKEFEGLYLVEYKTDFNTGKPIVWLFSRDKNGNKKIQKVEGYKPYFYVDFDFKLGDSSNTHTTIFGDKVKKITFDNPKDMYDMRRHIEEQGFKHYEADILYNNRFIIDNVDNIIKTEYKKFYIDIETLSEGGFPDVNITQQPITCITIYNSFNKKYFTWIWRKDFNFSQVKGINDNNIIYKFSNESDMLQHMLNYFESEKPDIILGWNVVHFDMKYLLNRMKNIFSLNIKKMSPMNICYVQDDIENKASGQTFKGIPIIKGIVTFDLLNYYRKMHKGELSSYSLNNVAQEELGDKKTDSHHVVDDDWLTNWMNVVKYNVKDVELTYRIDDKVGVFDFFDQMRTISHVNIDDCKYYGRVVDTFILRYAKQKNIVLPSKKNYVAGQALEGGFVMDPQIGLHKNVIVIDLNSIYPNLIDTFNLSPECRDEEGDININGIKFNSKEKGLIPSVLSELGELRNRFKGKMKELRYDDPEFKLFDSKQQAAKNLACTVYGVNALSSFRLNTDYVAQTITHLGRELVMWMRDFIEEQGYKVIYTDTDSNFIKLNDEFDAEKCIEVGHNLSDLINKNIYKFVEKYGFKGEHTLGVDFEKLYKRLLLTAKKRYAGWVIYKDGEKDDYMQLMGLDAKRSDTSKFSKELQKNLLNMILKNESYEDIYYYLKSKLDDIKKLPLEDIAIPVKFEKPLDDYATDIPRVRGARWANENLKKDKLYTAGSKVLLLYTKGEHDAICFDEERQIKDFNIQVDYKKMMEKLVFMKIERILESVNYNSIILNLKSEYMENNNLLTKWL